jgi:uncharacterized protein YqjF (DUF2071 family)
MLQTWTRCAFLHWRVEPSALRPLVPDELEIDEFDGSAWVGLVPFRMTVRAPLLPPVPVLSTFPETNVRTYVRDGSGRRGLWFLSLDVPRSAMVLAARVSLGLPYAWSRMAIQERDDATVYSATRIAPDGGVHSAVTVPAGGASVGGAELVHFLTARFRLFGRGPLGSFVLSVEHPPWPLVRPARSRVLVEDELVGRAGIAPVRGRPDHVLTSPGVAVRVGLPRRLGRG